MILSPEMRPLADGTEQLNLEATSYRELVRRLRERFPALTQSVFDRTSVAIDGELIPSPLLEAIGPDSEVVFVTRIAGG